MKGGIKGTGRDAGWQRVTGRLIRIGRWRGATAASGRRKGGEADAESGARRVGRGALWQSYITGKAPQISQDCEVIP